eukprot:COSAG05_NODE_1397_length_4981_cov_8.111020_2_plen_85_part_00
MEAAFNDFEEAASILIKFSAEAGNKSSLNAQNAVRLPARTSQIPFCQYALYMILPVPCGATVRVGAQRFILQLSKVTRVFARCW